MANDCKYQRKQYQISYDSGSTWHNAVPARYEKGELTEYSSPDCSGIEVQYRWRELEGQYICIDNNKYTKEIREESYDNGATWYVSYPVMYKEGYFVEYNEEYCSFKFKGHYISNDPPSRKGVCPMNMYWNGHACYPKCDPLKIVKCNNSNILTRDETIYYISYYKIFKAEIGPCVKQIGNGSSPVFAVSFDVYDLPILTEIIISEGPEIIAAKAFSGCTSLPNIILPNTLKTIGNNAFERCWNLSSITIPSSVTSIGSNAFSGCTSLSSVVLNNGLKTIGGGAFIRCHFANITIPDSVTSLGANAFTNCTGLTNCTIGSGVRSIGSKAFSGCTSLSNITVKAATPPSLGSGAFDGSSCSIFVPCGSKVLYQSASGWSSYSNRIKVTTPCQDPIKLQLTYTGGSSYIDYCGINEPISSADTHPSGYQYTAMTDAVIGDCVTTIGTNAFRSCTSLSSCTIGSGVTSIGGSAFYSAASLTNIVIPDSVTTIGANAFYRCSGLTSCTIGSGVTSIGASAFNGCNISNDIVLSSGITSIGYGAFCGNSITSITVLATTPPTLGTYAFRYGGCPIYVPCDYVDAYKNANGWSTYADRIQPISGSCRSKFTATYLDSSTYDIACSSTNTTLSSGETRPNGYQYTAMTDAVIGDCVYAIGDEAFNEYNNLTGVTWEVSYNNSRIAKMAFRYCSNLSRFNSDTDGVINIPNGVEYVLEYSFAGCNSIINAITPDSIYLLGSGAFANCQNLTGCTLGSSLTYVGDSVFDGCRSLQNIRIPRNVSNITKYMFSGCYSLTSCTIDNGVGGINERAFRYCTGLTSIGDIGSGSSIEIPNSLKTIGQSAFENCRNITNVVIPQDSVTTIYIEAFSGCSSLSSCTIGSGVTSIAMGAFDSCTSLTEITIPDSVTSIGDGVFQNCTGLTSCTIGSGVTSISNKTFSGCTSLSSCTIGSGVTSIGASAFTDCASLSNITIPSSVRTIGYNAFRNVGLTNITIPDSVTSLGASAFTNCTSLSSCTIGSGVTIINTSTFENCTSLSSVNIPNSVTSIRIAAFANCSSLQSITIPSGVTSIGSNAFRFCGSLSSITVDAGNTSYDSRNNCNALINTNTNELIAGCSSTIIPDSVTSIGLGAFQNCTGLTSIDIPSGVTNIGGNAFYGCANLTSITIEAITPPTLGGFVFTNSVIIYVPVDSVDTYKAASGWSNYSSQIQAIP